MSASGSLSGSPETIRRAISGLASLAFVPPGLPEPALNKAREKLFDALYDLRKNTLTQMQADVIRAGIEKSLRTLRRRSGDQDAKSEG